MSATHALPRTSDPRHLRWSLGKNGRFLFVIANAREVPMICSVFLSTNPGGSTRDLDASKFATQPLSSHEHDSLSLQSSSSANHSEGFRVLAPRGRSALTGRPTATRPCTLRRLFGCLLTLFVRVLS